MPYTYQHYPLALYRKGAYMAVANEAEESASRAEGWTDYITDRIIAQAEANAQAPETVTVVADAVDVDELDFATAQAEPVAATIPVAPVPAKRKPGRPPKAK